MYQIEARKLRDSTNLVAPRSSRRPCELIIGADGSLHGVIFPADSPQDGAAALGESSKDCCDHSKAPPDPVDGQNQEAGAPKASREDAPAVDAQPLPMQSIELLQPAAEAPSGGDAEAADRCRAAVSAGAFRTASSPICSQPPAAIGPGGGQAAAGAAAAGAPAKDSCPQALVAAPQTTSRRRVDWCGLLAIGSTLALLACLLAAGPNWSLPPAPLLEGAPVGTPAVAQPAEPHRKAAASRLAPGAVTAAAAARRDDKRSSPTALAAQPCWRAKHEPMEAHSEGSDLSSAPCQLPPSAAQHQQPDLLVPTIALPVLQSTEHDGRSDEVALMGRSRAIQVAAFFLGAALVFGAAAAAVCSASWLQPALMTLRFAGRGIRPPPEATALQQHISSGTEPRTAIQHQETVGPVAAAASGTGSTVLRRSSHARRCSTVGA